MALRAVGIKRDVLAKSAQTMDSFDDDSHERFLSGEPIGGPFARIVEQPAKCGVRFRYECEGRISGAIPGQNSTTLRPTFPTIKLFNYSGRAKVVVSCVTKSRSRRVVCLPVLTLTPSPRPALPTASAQFGRQEVVQRRRLSTRLLRRNLRFQ
jgi:hypothetical protein